MSKDGPRGPALLIFDVNETLSDMSPLRGRFEEVGAPGHLAATWFAGLLRDGFALTVSGASGSFARIAAEALRVTIHCQPLNRSTDDAVRHVMDGFAVLTVHTDVPDGVRALRRLGIRLVTLSNGSVSVAEALLDHAALRGQFEALLSVEGAGSWKPAMDAYSYALDRCDVTPWTPCSSLSTRGISTVRRAQDSVRPGSTGPEPPTRRTSGRPTSVRDR